MYPLKKSIESTENVSAEECFGAQIKYWLWIMLIVMVGTIIFAILSLRRPAPVYPSVAVSVPQGGQLQPIAWTRQCPNCVLGHLDAQGQCNVASCQLYRPGWGGRARMARNALAPCPRCVGGQLDVYGRCNQRGCVLSGGPGTQAGQTQPVVGIGRCPNCVQGVLDAQGRCNVANCPLYRPGQRGQVPVGQNIAWTPCPRCANGQLDAQGRCNVAGCRLYRPGWGGQGRMAQNALSPCPQCANGQLDAQGRCNVAGCRLYRPGWGGQASMGQTVALIPCPRCRGGQLDIYGRCNQKGCVLYGGGTGTQGNTIPVKALLIKELAMTIGATQGKNTVIVQSVYGSGNADKAGLKVGDRVTRFNGRKITSVKQFLSTVARAAPEAAVKIEVFRLEKKQTLKVMVGEGEMEGAVIPPVK